MPFFRRRRRPRRTLSTAEVARRATARPLILAKVAYWSTLMAIPYGRVAVRDQRTRWGSASSLGNLNFNWRIAEMPEAVFDYIVIHELAHLKELNHSPRFWAVVAEYCSDYRAQRRWLREYSRQRQMSLS